jgi:hypothetical protein
MPKQMDINEILKNNPHIDRDKLATIAELGEKLKALGLERKGYRLGSPSRVRIDQDNDSRTAHLRRKR